MVTAAAAACQRANAQPGAGPRSRSRALDRSGVSAPRYHSESGPYGAAGIISGIRLLSIGMSWDIIEDFVGHVP